jgi:serine/threonine-protein kinase
MISIKRVQTSGTANFVSGVGLSEREAAERSALQRATEGQYQIVRAIGRGGMGAVYLARDRALHRVVAIKLLLVAEADHAARERFRREARLGAQLNHPNVVPLYAFAETPELLYMVMQYVHGESLGERLRRVGRLDAEETRRLLAALALTLEYAHAHGVVHRDLKPENILLERDTGRPMLMDFGVALLRTWDTTGGTRQAAGTPHFMAPEQLLGDPDLDGRSDLYALGALGYLMLTGSTPFAGPSGQLVASRVLTMLPPPLAERAPWVPADLARTITRCLEKRPEERWRHARDLHDALMGVGRRRSRVWRRLTAAIGQAAAGIFAL